MLMNREPSKHFNTLIKSDDIIMLCGKQDIYTGVYGSDIINWDILIKDDNGILTRPNEQLVYSEAWLDDMYERVEPGNEDGDTIYMEYEYEDEPIAVRKITDYDSEIKQLFIDVEHGINRDEICITDADIIHGKVYQAPAYTPQVYPTQAYEDAFLFVSENGDKVCIERTIPFNPDQSRDIFEVISEEEIEQFCD